MSKFDVSLPWWAWVLMGLGLAGFAAMVAVSVVRNRGVKRSLFASPYALWMILFTVVPLVIIVYYALTDSAGRFTMDNLRNFWDSNFARRMAATSDAARARYAERGMSNMDPLLYSLWMAFLCTAICLVLAYPTALFMADRKMKRAGSLVILFVVPMWMNITLRTYAMTIPMSLMNLMDTPTAVLIGMVYNFLPFMVLPIYNSISKIDINVINAARDLGANGLQVFLRILLPLSIPGIISGITMVFIPALTTFVISKLLGGSKILLIGNVIEEEFTQASNWNLGSGLSIVLMIFIIFNMFLSAAFDKGGESNFL